MHNSSKHPGPWVLKQTLQTIKVDGDAAIVVLAALHRTFGGLIENYTRSCRVENRALQIGFEDELTHVTATLLNRQLEVIFATNPGAKPLGWRQRNHLRRCQSAFARHLNNCLQEWQQQSALDGPLPDGSRLEDATLHRALFLNLNSPNTIFYLQAAAPWGAYSIIFISILFYLATAYFSNSMLTFTTKALIQSGALYNVAFFNENWYTLFTALFVHGGPMHLFVNLLILYLWAINIEPLIGKWRLLLVFVTSGIIAFVVSLMVRHNSWVIMYGASSGVFGILGCMLSIFYLLHRPLVHYHLFSLQTLLFIAVSLLGSRDSNVDTVGHIAGFFAGLLLGMAFMRIHKQFHTLRQRMQAFAVVSGLLMATAMVVVYNSRQNAVGFLRLYQQSTQQIDALFDDADRAADSSYTLLQQRATENDLAYQKLLLQLQRLQQYKKIDSTEQKKAALLLQITQMDYDWLQKIPETDSEIIWNARARYLEQRRQLVKKLHEDEN